MLVSQSLSTICGTTLVRRHLYYQVGASVPFILVCTRSYGPQIIEVCPSYSIVYVLMCTFISDVHSEHLRTSYCIDCDF